MLKDHHEWKQEPGSVWVGHRVVRPGLASVSPTECKPLQRKGRSSSPLNPQSLAQCIEHRTIQSFLENRDNAKPPTFHLLLKDLTQCQAQGDSVNAYFQVIGWILSRKLPQSLCCCLALDVLPNLNWGKGGSVPKSLWKNFVLSQMPFLSVSDRA